MGRTTAWALAALVLAGCSPVAQTAPPQPPSTLATTTTTSPGTLARPHVGEADLGRSRYVRDQWQAHGWADVDGDGCNTREEVLIAESLVPPRRGPGCTILSGEWDDRYTGRRATSPAALEIDHLVALSDAHASGGWAWSADRKVAFANNLDDADELNATWGPENQRKSDDGPDDWLPPNVAFRCAYVAAYVAIKARWGLSVTPAQWAAVEREWSVCGAPRPTTGPPPATDASRNEGSGEDVDAGAQAGS